MKHIPAFALMSTALVLAVLYLGTRHDVLVAAFMVAALALAAMLFIRRADSTSAATLIDGAVFAFGAWLVLAVLLSGVPFISANSALALALLFFGYGFARMAAGDGFHAQVLLWIVAVTGIGLLAWALWQFAGGMNRPQGPFINHNNFAALLFLTSLFAGAALHTLPAVAEGNGRRWKAPVLGGIALFTFLAIGLIGSRGALLGAFFAIALLGFLLYRQPRPVIAYTLGAGTGLAGSALLSNLYVVQRLSSLAEPELAGASRFRIWESVLPLIAEKPLFGHGPGTLFLVWGPHRHPQDGSGGFHVHNDLLAFAIAGGIPAAILFVVVIAVALWAVFRQSYLQPNEPATIRNAWLGAGLAGVALHAMFTFNFSIASLLLLSGLVLGFIAPVAAPLRTPLARTSVRVGKVVAIFVALGLSVYAGTSFVGYYHHLIAKRAEQSGDMNGALESVSKAIGWWPSADSWRVQRAHIVLTGVLETGNVFENPMAADALQLALIDTEQALRLNPYRQAAYQTAARVQLAGARLEIISDGEVVAEALLREGLTRSPRNLLTRYRLAQLLERRGKPEAALELVLDGMEFRYPRTGAREEFYQYAHELAQRLGDEEATARIPG